jgi:hypothetical protein
MSTFATGERWRYRNQDAGMDDSRIVIGAVLAFPTGPTLVCCAVFGAASRRADGGLERITIPFLPMTQSAVAASVTQRDGEAFLPPHFQAQFDNWRQDTRGLTYFTVPFEGRLDRMIARQMAELIGTDGSTV